MSLLENFTPLDDIIQVIYQGASRFVMLSHVSESEAESGANMEWKWVVHVGLGDNKLMRGTGRGRGRWWRGCWTDEDVVRFVGSNNTSEERLEAFCETLVRSIVNCDISIGNWDGGEGEGINITFNPTAKKSLVMPLKELAAEEASAFAANQLFSIGLQAQARKCQINVLPYQANVEFGESSTMDGRQVGLSKSLERDPKKRDRSRGISSQHQRSLNQDKDQQSKHEKTREEIKVLKAQLAKAREDTKKVNLVLGLERDKGEEREPPIQPKQPKGASLANPNKKARRVKAMEFADD